MLNRTVVFRFYAELNDFMPPERRQVPFEHAFGGRVSVKDMIEALGVPHTEVDLILVNGQSVDFSYLVRDSDRVSVFPVFESIDISQIQNVRPRPLRQPRFVLDTHLGRLAGYLRMLGFDAEYETHAEDDGLADRAGKAGRILLTRDRQLLKRKIVTHGYYVRSTNPRDQLVEVLRRFDLSGSILPFARCIACNGEIASVPKEAVEHRLPPKTRSYYDAFQQCTNCGKVYWRGSHFDRMEAFVEGVVEQARRASPA